MRITADPGSSTANKTGSWRTKQKPHYLRQNCIACRKCVLICPEAIVTGKEKNTFKPDLQYCKGCGLCAVICPKDDIEMVSESTTEHKK